MKRFSTPRICFLASFLVSLFLMQFCLKLNGVETPLNTLNNESDDKQEEQFIDSIPSINVDTINAYDSNQTPNTRC